MINKVCSALVRGQGNTMHEVALALFIRVKSSLRDAFHGELRKSLPKFYRPEEAGEYLAWNQLTLTVKASNYIPDFSTHPEALEAFMLGGNRDITGVGPEDGATWAYKALEGIRECEPKLVTLFRGDGVCPRVVCVYKLKDKYGSIDNGGHRELPDLMPATIERAYSFLDKCHYVASVDTLNPYS